MSLDPDPLIEYKKSPFDDKSTDESVPTISQFLDEQYRRHKKFSNIIKLIIGPLLISLVFWSFYMSKEIDQNCQLLGCLEYSKFKSENKNYILNYVDLQHEEFLSHVNTTNLSKKLSELSENKISKLSKVCNNTSSKDEKCIKFEKSLNAAISLREEIHILNSKQGLTLHSLRALIDEFHEIVQSDESKIDVELLSQKAIELENEVERLANETSSKQTEYAAREAEKEEKVNHLLKPFGGSEFMINQNE
jgi:hypothetical protein